MKTGSCHDANFFNPTWWHWALALWHNPMDKMIFCLNVQHTNIIETSADLPIFGTKGILDTEIQF